MNGPLVDVLGEPYELFRELECYNAAWNAEKARRAKREQHRNRRRHR